MLLSNRIAGVIGSRKQQYELDLAQDEKMKGPLKLGFISNDADGKPHRIPGRLTDAQRVLIGKRYNNAPPNLKNAADKEILHTAAWGEECGFNFSKVVCNHYLEIPTFQTPNCLSRLSISV